MHGATYHSSPLAAAAAASPPRLLVVHPGSQPEASLQEALRLGESYAGQLPAHVTMGSAARRQRPSPATFFGRGQVEALLAQVHAAEPERVFVNHALSGVQQRNLERALGRPVLDRVALIIEIFSQRARTNEARLQVELAQLEYASSRLVRVVDAASGRRTAFGMTGHMVEVVSARERGRSGSSTGGLGGAGGQGESELQLQRRRITDRRRQLLRGLEQVRKTRAVQRAARQRSGKPQVAIVGYTNAGKSSLLEALSGAGDVGVEDRLFATLDPTLRRVMLPRSGKDAILSDTVGFISNLPTQLIEAFRATLEEVTEADLLLHVLDVSSPQVLAQRQAVLHVLRELGLTQQQLEERVVEVWNKMDQLPAAADVAAAVAAGGAAAEEQASDGEAAAAGHEVEAAADEAAAVVVAGQEVAAAAGEAGAGGGGAACTGGAGAAEEAAAMAAAGSKQQQQQQQQHGTATQPAEQPASLVDAAGSSGLHAAAAAGLLPPAVEALLRSDVRAASYRPTAVATSVLRGQGLAELLAAVEDKLEGLLAGRPQLSAKSQAPAAFALSREVIMHDRANLLALPVIGTLVLAGLFGWCDTMLVTKAFILYIAVDFFWVLLEPKAVPSKPRIILWHHFITFLLLQLPLRHPQLGLYTCMDGLVEWNTLLLIARRQFPRWYRPLNAVYWVTFYPVRVVLFPALMPLFWRELTKPGYAWWETAAVMLTQACLVVFNGWFLVASWKRRR
ncbi:GTP-binding chloroplastic [Micractinium conductrix]|uniref:GTP-binding chloroplastic n=1 Tax=Micractinium conductrix TaxID=554055 RepID=A0A2P6VIP9_9CHLO|nr:GTP-binding chloroplastic [Micractinium conductrix]|eukprot:PSC73950.1 GTP-binding chloroplastic [Micractinium conductrix]